METVRLGDSAARAGWVAKEQVGEASGEAAMVAAVEAEWAAKAEAMEEAAARAVSEGAAAVVGSEETGAAGDLGAAEDWAEGLEGEGWQVHCPAQSSRSMPLTYTSAGRLQRQSRQRSLSRLASNQCTRCLQLHQKCREKAAQWNSWTSTATEYL